MTIRVFELAREVNLPSKSLLEQLQAWGYDANGNFSGISDEDATEIKKRLKNWKKTANTTSKTPIVSESKSFTPLALKKSAATAPPPPVETEAPPQEDAPPTKTAPRRRLVSVRSSGEVTKIEKASVPEPVVEDKEPPALEAIAATEEEILPTPPSNESIDEPPAVTEQLPEVVVAAAEVTLPEVHLESDKTNTQETEPAAIGAGQEPASTKKTKESDFKRAVVVRLSNAEEEEKARSDWKEQKKRSQRPRRNEAGMPLHNLRASAPDWENLQNDDWIRPRRSKTGAANTKNTGRRKKAAHVFNPRQKAIRIGQSISIGKLAGEIGIKGIDIISKLSSLDINVSMSDSIDGPTAELVAADYGVEVIITANSLEELTKEEVIQKEDLQPRPAVVTVMGHVDHGKTTLVDYIRKSDVALGESGGITQHIGAYRVKLDNGELVFLDTPGHEAFTALRRRGASITDIVVVVVAANDGVMPQTKEAIDHVRAAGVPMIIAINKMDHPNADAEQTKQKLLEHDVVVEDFGGNVPVALISALKGDGIPELLELIHLQAELLELRSIDSGRCHGRVIEAELHPQKGPLTTILLKRGTLKIGDYFVSGTAYGKVRLLENEYGQSMKVAQMGMPVRIIGFNQVPEAGDEFVSLPNEKTARQVTEMRVERLLENTQESSPANLLEAFLNDTQPNEEVRQLSLILKADTQGSLEAVQEALFKRMDENAKVSVIRSGVGHISETDVDLAAVSKGLVVGFHVKSEGKAAQLAHQYGVNVRLYTIIYELIDEVLMALEGMLDPVTKEEVMGHCEVRSIFSTSREGRIAGGFITDGKIDRDCLVRVYRKDAVIHSGSLNSLRSFKTDVPIVQSGNECGFRVSNFNDIEPGDRIEAYILVEEKPSLQRPS